MAKSGHVSLIQYTLLQFYIWINEARRRDILLLVVNGVFLAAGIFANLAFEVIGLDLYVIVLLAFLALVIWWRYGGQPLVIYYTTAYSLGLVATVLYKLFSG